MKATGTARGVSGSLLLAALILVAVAAAISGLVLFTRPSGPSVTSSQTSTSTKLVFTDILTPGSPNASITVKANEVFVIHLTANTGSTGYDWNVSTSAGIRYLNYTTTSVGTVPGAPDGRDYVFQAVKPGPGTIDLVYGRFPPAFSEPVTAVTLRVSVAVTQ